jgi:hypothetical protein
VDLQFRYNFASLRLFVRTTIQQVNVPDGCEVLLKRAVLIPIDAEYGSPVQDAAKRIEPLNAQLNATV